MKNCLFTSGGLTGTMKTLLELEQAFFKKQYISDPEWLNATLHEDFTECGKSGILFGKKEVMESLLSCAADRDIVIYNFSCEQIDENSWMVHYITESEGEHYYRTSIWSRGEQLQLRFHQATKLNCDRECIKCESID